MCIFGGGGSAPPPPVLPPPPPPPLPPTPPVDPAEPLVKPINPQVKRAKDDRGNKSKNQYSRGTGSLRIRLNTKKPKVNTGTDNDMSAGGLN